MGRAMLFDILNHGPNSVPESVRVTPGARVRAGQFSVGDSKLR